MKLWKKLKLEKLKPESWQDWMVILTMTVIPLIISILATMSAWENIFGLTAFIFPILVYIISVMGLAIILPLLFL
jgi:fatty-acid desaturase